MDQSDHINTPEPKSDAASVEPPRRSPWSKKALLIRILWGVCETLLWRPSPVWAWRFRASLLRLFGAKIGQGVRIHPSVKVIIPWHLRIRDGVRIHERAILYALGEIDMGDHSVVGPLAHLCAGTHDFTDPAFTLLCQPIVIGKRCVLGAGCFVAPNITLADDTVLMPRSAMYAQSEPGTCYQGNPAKLFVPVSSAFSFTNEIPTDLEPNPESKRGVQG